MGAIRANLRIRDWLLRPETSMLQADSKSRIPLANAVRPVWFRASASLRSPPTINKSHKRPRDCVISHASHASGHNMVAACGGLLGDGVSHKTLWCWTPDASGDH